MNHTGVCGTGSPRTALRKALSQGGGGARVVTGQASQVTRRVRTPVRAAPTYCGPMVARPETHPGPGADTTPPAFRAAVATMHAAPLRPEVSCESMPAPQRIAPHAAAMSADVTVDDTDVGTGRIILLHDPAGNDAWDGDCRCVAYVRADIDLELVTDPLLAEVGWSWLSESLDAHGAGHHAASGTVTRVATESFGGMADEPGTAQLEVRASWTPAPDADGQLDLGPHVEAWGELLCTAAGLPPVPDGVAVMPSRRGQRGPGPDVDDQPTPPRAATCPPSAPSRAVADADEVEPEPELPLLTLRDGLPPSPTPTPGLRERRRRRSPPAPARWPSTPSAPRATATPTAPT